MQFDRNSLDNDESRCSSIENRSRSNGRLYEVKDFTISELEYWGKGITEDDLRRYNICSLSYYSDHTATEDNFIYGIINNDTLMKVIIPQKGIYHCFSNNQFSSFGYNFRSNRKVKELIITSDERDVINLQKSGYHAICFECDLSEIPEEIISELIFKSKELYVSFGSDKNAKSEVEKLWNKYDFIKQILLPNDLLFNKNAYSKVAASSVTDYFRHYTSSDYDSLIDKAFLFSNHIVLKKEHEFWSVKKLKNNEIRYKFLPGRISKFLTSNGIFEYRFNDNKPTLIKINNPWIEEISIGFVQKLLRIVSKEYGNEDILDVVINGLRSFSDKKLVSLIDSKRELEFDNGFPHSQIFLFKGKFLKVTKDQIQDYKLDNFQNYIWRNHEIPFLPIIEKDYYQISKSPSGFHINIMDNSCDFLRYLKNTSSIYHAESYKTVDMITEENLHMISKITALGYLFHTYLVKSKSRAVIAFDYSSLFSKRADGGTGKSILGTALSRMISTEEFDGKDKQLVKKDTGFSRVTDKTRLIVIDDVPKGFNLEDLFAKITGRFNLRNRYHDARILPEDQSIKFYLSTNDFFDLSHKSKDRRAFGIYFSDYYDHKRITPASEFGYDFFSNQEPYAQRNKFYNLMMQCLKTYLEYGLIEAKVPDVKIKLMKDKIGEDFLEWADEFFELYEFGERIYRVEFEASFENYVSESNGKEIGSRESKVKLKLYCELRNYAFNPAKNGKDHRSNSREYYIIQKKGNIEVKKSK
ncbi:hypothetical protein [Marinifilum sp.]|uniref:hypothetical protein n=1 Tax=Marinifilum sp. TaxID=2033137 RepID=UPI003BAAEFED